jgi:hypothetical protein
VSDDLITIRDVKALLEKHPKKGEQTIAVLEGLRQFRGAFLHPAANEILQYFIKRHEQLLQEIYELPVNEEDRIQATYKKIELKVLAGFIDHVIGKFSAYESLQKQIIKEVR